MPHLGTRTTLGRPQAPGCRARHPPRSRLTACPSTPCRRRSGAAAGPRRASPTRRSGSSPRPSTSSASSGTTARPCAASPARAGVDSALLHHYFGTKADLFAQTVGAPMRPDLDIPALLDGPAGRARRAHRALRARGVGAPRDPQARRGAAALGHRQPADDAAAGRLPPARADRPHRRARSTRRMPRSARRSWRARSPGMLHRPLRAAAAGAGRVRASTSSSRGSARPSSAT